MAKCSTSAVPQQVNLCPSSWCTFGGTTNNQCSVLVTIYAKTLFIRLRCTGGVPKERFWGINVGGRWPLKESDTLGIWLPPKHVLWSIQRPVGMYRVLDSRSWVTKKHAIWQFYHYPTIYPKGACINFGILGRELDISNLAKLQLDQFRGFGAPTMQAGPCLEKKMWRSFPKKFTTFLVVALKNILNIACCYVSSCGGPFCGGPCSAEHAEHA